MSDHCPCGAVLTLDPINLAVAGFPAHCAAGHRVLLPDLDGSPGVILDEIESDRL